MFSRKRNERGAITVEATIALTSFMFMFMMLFSIVTICRAQAIVGSALNNTAKEVSQYTYLYSLTGIHESIGEATSTDVTMDFDVLATDINTSLNSMQKMNDDASTLVQTDIDDLPDLLNSWHTLSTTLPDDAEQVGSDLKAVKEQIEQMASDPKRLLIGLGKIAASDGISLVKSKLITPPICKVLMKKHLKSYEDQDTEAFLKNLNIVPDESGGEVSYIDGLDFTNSSLFSSSDYDIILRVEYQVRVTPYLPIDIKINLCQSAVTRGWADGDGRHVLDDGEVLLIEPEVETESIVTPENNTEETTGEGETTSEGEITPEESSTEESSGEEETTTLAGEIPSGGVVVPIPGETTTEEETTTVIERSPREQMIEKYGKTTVEIVEEAYTTNKIDVNTWDVDTWEYYIGLYKKDIEKYKQKYCSANVLSYATGMSVSTALKMGVDDIIERYPDKRAEMEKFYSEDEFKKLICRGLDGFLKEEHVELPDSRYSTEEKELLELVHEYVRPNDSSIIQKVITESDAKTYFIGSKNTQVRGCVARVQDVLYYTSTFDSMVKNLRMDYAGSDFTKGSMNSFYVLRGTTEGTQYETPMNPKPGTKNGFLGTETAILPEWQPKSRSTVLEGAMFRINADGSEEFVGFILDGYFIEDATFKDNN